MKFYIYEYTDDELVNNIGNIDSDNIIIEDEYIFIHNEKFSETFKNKFKNQQGEEENSQYLEQLKKQVFILINKSNNQ